MKHEDRIEELSFQAGGGKEEFRYFWGAGTYHCARCALPLYSSKAKWNGPCVWPSFRAAVVELPGGHEDKQLVVPNSDPDIDGDAASENTKSINSKATPTSSDSVTLSLRTKEVFNYNNYTCRVFEVYCGGCQLFVGHKFEDGAQKGDSHPEARWRH